MGAHFLGFVQVDGLFFLVGVEVPSVAMDLVKTALDRKISFDECG